MAASTKQKNPKTVTIYGRLSFPTFTAQEAYDRSLKGDYPAKSVQDAKPDFQLLVENHQLEKLVNHIETVFLPYCVEQEKNGEKKDKLTKKEADDLLKQVKSVSDSPYNTPLKPVHEKTAPLVPECVATVKVIGNAGVDMDLSAIVTDEDDLVVNDGSILSFPVVRPINETKFSMYAGAMVACTLNLYAYHNGKNPGFSAGGSTAVFKADADRIGGGVTVDEDEIFAD